MKLSLFTITLLLGIALNSFGQALPDLIPYRVKDKWGFSDSTGKIIIEPTYYYVDIFRGKLAIVSIGPNLWGAINKKGEIVIPAIYERVDKINDYYRVKILNAELSGSFRHYDENYKRIDDFEDPVYEKMIVALNRKYGRNVYNVIRLYDDIYQARYDTSYTQYVEHGYQVYDEEVTTAMFFMCNGKSDMLTRPVSGNIRMLNREFYYIGSAKHTRLYKVKDGKAEVAVDKISSMSSSEEGLYRLTTDTSSYILDSANSKLIRCPRSFLRVEKFKNGYAHVTKNNGTAVLIDRTGNPFTAAHHYFGDYSEGLCMFQAKSGKCGYIDKSGKEVIPAQYTRAFDFKEGMALVELNGDFFYIDLNGNKALDIPYTFENSIKKGLRIGAFNITNKDFYGFSGGMALIEENKKFGYIDKTGKLIIPAIYDYAGPFIGNYAFVFMPSDSIKGSFDYFLIDRTGKKVHKYGYIYSYGEFSRYAAGYHENTFLVAGNLFATSDRDNWSIYDRSGNEITEERINTVHREIIAGGRLIKVSLNKGNHSEAGYISDKGFKYYQD